MAMYYQNSSEMQADGLHTLYLMNPNYAPYSDAQPNMLFFNPTTSSAAAAVIPHAPLHHFTGIPLSHDPNRSLPPPAALAQQQDIPAAAAQTPIPRLHYNTWGLVDQPQQTPRGLSLSLSAHHQAARAGFDKPSVSGDHGFPTGQSSVGMKSPESNGANSMNILGSKYLKAAQEVLEEVVSFDPGAAAPPRKEKAKAAREKAGESGIKSELTTAQRQEIQMKKSKLHSMLDEVEQRCRQYDEQMQIVVAAFEQAAGRGSAGAYTQLALKTILKQFGGLKSRICAQIKAGDDESRVEKAGWRLKFVDSHQNNAWRPQRGLPERAVSLLRAWLFQHFLHPYPKDSDKQMLAKQTGLTRSQETMNREWMYRRFTPDGYISREFDEGVESFIEFAAGQPSFMDRDLIKCPCRKCNNQAYCDLDTVRIHLPTNGFVFNYHVWTYQGERPHAVGNRRPRPDVGSSSSSAGGQFRQIIFDAAGPTLNMDYHHHNDDEDMEDVEEPPNAEAQQFFDMLRAADTKSFTPVSLSGLLRTR